MAATASTASAKAAPMTKRKSGHIRYTVLRPASCRTSSDTRMVAGMNRHRPRGDSPPACIAESAQGGDQKSFAPRRTGPVAQWLEPTAHNGLVGGSSPPGPTSSWEFSDEREKDDDESQ